MTEPRSRRSRGSKSPSAPARRRRPRLPAAVQAAIAAAQGRKAVDLLVLDLRASGAFTDFFVIATGASSRQVQAIADAVEQALKSSGIRPTNIEGYRLAEWVLLDYFDFVVHVFSPAARAFYGLERLWATARHVPVDDRPAGTA